MACGFGGGDIQRFSDGFRSAAVVVQQPHRSVAWKADDSHFGRTMRLSSSSSNNRRSHSKNEEDVKNAETADQGMMFRSQADADVPTWHATATTSSSSSFNPFAYDASTMGRTGFSSSSSTSTSTTKTKNNVVSLRSLQMQDLNDQLLAATSIDERYAILVAHRDLLLAPIVDGDTAVGGIDNNDSIYRNCSTIPERYSAFATNLTTRIDRAQSPIVRTILQEMKDYVLGTQQQPPPPPPEQQEPSKTT
jgi:hypothetical protein